jgi:hypothetical protein
MARVSQRMPSEASQKIVDAMIAFMPGFATDFLGRKPRKKIRVTKKEKQKWAEELDGLLEAQKEIESYQTPPKTAAEYVSRLDRVGELYIPLLGRRPKGISFPESLKNSFRQTTDGVGRWTYFPSTNYHKVAADLDRLTSKAFVTNALAIDKLQSEFWGTLDAKVVMLATYNIMIRRCVYLGNAKRRLDRKVVERLIETYRELSGLYEKSIREVVGTMVILDGKEVAYADIAKRPLAANVKQVAKAYPWLTKDFDIVIRNSIAHFNYVVSYSSDNVDFVDNKTSVTVTFRDLFTRCRLLSSLVVAMLLLYVFFLYWRWKAIAEYYDSLKRQINQAKDSPGGSR